jgi:hypothetical protein
MKKNFKIFDVVLFDGNQDLLNLRFSEFYNMVDFFILIPLSDEIKYEIDIRFKDKVVLLETFKNETHFYDLLKEFLSANYESFDDLIFISKENEIPDFNNLDEIISETKIRNVFINHTTLCWNTDYFTKDSFLGTYVFTFSKFLTHGNIFKRFFGKNKSNVKEIKNGWKFLNFHEPTVDEVFARENLLPSVNYDSATTYKVIKTPSDFELPKNVGILAYNKIGRDYMKKHLFLVESSNTVNLNEISKLYDTVSIIEFSDKLNEVIAENIGESVYKSILHLPTNVLYGEKPLKDFHDDYKKNEIKKIIETVFPQDQDSIRIIYKGFNDVVGLWENFKNQKFSEIINPS